MKYATVLWFSIFSALLFVGAGVALEFKYTRKEIGYMFPKALARTIALCFLYTSLVVLPVGVVASILALQSLIMICLYAPLRGEKVNGLSVFYSTIAVIGVVLITRESLTKDLLVFDIKLLLPIAAAFFGAYSMTLWRDSSIEMNPIKNLGLLHSWTALLSAPVVIALSHTNNEAIRPNGNTLALFGLVLLACVGDICFVKAQRSVSLTANGVLIPTGTVFAAIFAMMILGQSLAWWQWTGMVIVAFGVSVANYTNQRISYTKHVSFLAVEPSRHSEWKRRISVELLRDPSSLRSSG